jgi:hypothetical protein
MKGIKGFQKGNKGFRTKESYLIQGLDRKGKNRPPFSKEWITNISKAQKNRLDLKGERSYFWKGGLPNCKICGKTLSTRKCVYCHSCRNHLPLSIERRQNISNKLTGIMPKNLTYKNKYSNVKQGNYNINGKTLFFRSAWEANYALYLDFLVKQNKVLKWEYEANVFIFEKIKFGTRSFRPDFKIFNNDGSVEYHEVKGWMDSKSATKLKRMRIYYPQIKLRLIGKKEYALLKSQVGLPLKFY